MGFRVREAPENYRAASERPAALIQKFAREARPRASVAASPSGCVIKGNRNRKGQWIYHLPSMPYYDVIRPEQIFCTEAEAQAAATGPQSCRDRNGRANSGARF